MKSTVLLPLLFSLAVSSSNAQLGEQRALFVMGGRSDYNPQVYMGLVD